MITAVEGVELPILGRVQSLIFRTNTGRTFGPFGGGEESGSEFRAEGTLLYISGQAGAELDGITLHFGDLSCPGWGSGSGSSESDDEDDEYPEIIIPTLPPDGENNQIIGTFPPDNEIIGNWSDYNPLPGNWSEYEYDISLWNETEPIK